MEKNELGSLYNCVKNSLSSYRQALKTARTEYIRKLIDNHQNNPRFLFSTVRWTNKQINKIIDQQIIQWWLFFLHTFDWIVCLCLYFLLHKSLIILNYTFPGALSEEILIQFYKCYRLFNLRVIQTQLKWDLISKSSFKEAPFFCNYFMTTLKYEVTTSGQSFPASLTY